MATSQTFGFYYVVDYYDGTGVHLSAGGATAGSFTVMDTADSAADGSTAPGSDLSFQGLPYQYLGLASGGVLATDNIFNTFVLSDTAGLAGTTVPLDTVSAYAYCYLAGTAIRTPDGERAVESLRRGDLVSTHDGRDVPVRWIGTQVRDARVAWLSGALPVRVRRGALGTDAQGAPVPVRDLCVSPDHALLVDGLLIHALALVNGTSITRVGGDELAQVAYFHIETEQHEIIVADGAPAETFIDNADRARFDNHAEWLALYPDAPAMTELPLGRVKLARQVPKRVAERLARIASALPVTAVDGVTRVA